MRRPALLLIGLLAGPLYALESGWEDAPRGAVRDEIGWITVMRDALATLQKNSDRTAGHVQIRRLAEASLKRQQAHVRESRLLWLTESLRALEKARIEAPEIEAVLKQAEATKDLQKEQQWQTLCDTAEIERGLGRLPAANHLIFQVLQENPAHPRAQQLLSELQIDLRAAIESRRSGLTAEHFVLSGFYAYGQADYAAAAEAWSKAQLVLQYAAAPEEAQRQAQALRFLPYYRIAAEHLAEWRERHETQKLFHEGLQRFEQKRYQRALEKFRQVAIRDPDFPQLGPHLAQAEAAVNKARLAQLSAEKQRRSAEWMKRGIAALEQGRFAEADDLFSRVIELDGGNAQAVSYRSMAQAEVRRRYDPAGAQQHYEAGLVAYAGGRLEDAIREWTVATRMNAQHQKAVQALVRVRKELALHRDAPLSR